MVLGLPFYARTKKWNFDQNNYKLYRDILMEGEGVDPEEEGFGDWQYNGKTTCFW